MRELPTGALTPIVDDDGQITPEFVEQLNSMRVPLQFTAAEIASSSSSLNRRKRYEGMIIFDTTNDRLLYSKGADATSEWAVIDTSTITPS